MREAEDLPRFWCGVCKRDVDRVEEFTDPILLRRYVIVYCHDEKQRQHVTRHDRFLDALTIIFDHDKSSGAV